MQKIRLKKPELHVIPQDVRSALVFSASIAELWNDLTPLARNAWICWITSAKKKETRLKRITRMQVDLSKRKKRPCCFAGCTHRK